VGYGLLVVPQNKEEDEDDAGHASRSSGLLQVEASQAKVSESGLKTSGGVARMVLVALLRWLHRVEAEDGRVDAMDRVGPFYPTLSFSLY
jgi:hypothetical protein